MSTYAQPKILAFLSDTATIAEGSVVKVGSARTNVALAVTSTSLILGLAQSPVANAGDPVEVALPGGGGKGLCGSGGSIAAGDFLTADTSGALVTTTTTGDRVIAIAMEAAASGDLFSVHVVMFIHP